MPALTLRRSEKPRSICILSFTRQPGTITWLRPRVQSLFMFMLIYVNRKSSESTMALTPMSYDCYVLHDIHDTTMVGESFTMNMWV